MEADIASQAVGLSSNDFSIINDFYEKIRTKNEKRKTKKGKLNGKLEGKLN